MDPETRRILQGIAATTEENNELLRKMHRSIIVGRIFRVTYWLVILAFAVGAFYLVQPYVEAVGNMVGFSFGESGDFLEFFSKFR